RLAARPADQASGNASPGTGSGRGGCPMNQVTDTMPLTTDPLWPWSIPGIGMGALIITAIVLIGAAAWSYLRVPGAKLRRVGVVLGLRIFALFLVFLALTGASCVSRDELKVPSLLIIAIDISEGLSGV